MIQFIGALIYFLSGSFSFVISYIFWKTKDGILRKIMMSIFFTLWLALWLRAARIIHIPSEDNIVTSIIIFPLFLSLGIGSRWLYKHYYKK